MPTFDTYTKRKRRATEGEPGPLQYDTLPEPLRVQIGYMWRDTLGLYQKQSPYDFSDPPPANKRWRTIFDVIVRERGVVSLGRPKDNPCEQCFHLLLHGETDDVLEVIEMTFRYMDVVMRDQSNASRRMEGLKQSAEDAIDELNIRLKEHAVGYRYVDGQIVRMDSELLHTEVTLPALRLLHEEGFEGPIEEFMEAHGHYRKGELKDANVDAQSAFESTIKAICDKRKWKYSPSSKGAQLVKLVVSKGLIPPELQGHFEHLLKAMESGLPPVRSSYGAHGQGAKRKTVEDHLAAYALHLMAANIVLLIEAHRDLR